MDGLIKIKEISDKYDITARTLRYYEDMELIVSTRSDDYAYRMYDESNVKKIEQILVLRKLNISIKEIKRIFSTPGSDIVLEILQQKVENIDDEIELLKELKAIMKDFIEQIETMDFCNDSDVKMLYDKAKEIETNLISVDYIGKPANIGRLLEAAEKLEKEPDVLIVEMPPCRMVTSDRPGDEDQLYPFDAMWMSLGSRIADKINPRDFMYHDAERNKSVWMFLLEDNMTEADTHGFDIITFQGGLFAAVLADSWEYSEYDRMSKGIASWMKRQEHLELDDDSERHLLYHFAGPHSAKMKEWNYGKVRYFFPIKIK